MIGKPEWFMPRKFGWGLGIRSWQGVAYIAVWMAVVAAIGILPISLEIRCGLIGLVILVIFADTLNIMGKVYSKLDEREEKHQLVAERNAAFTAVAGIIVYLGYVVALGISRNQPPAMEQVGGLVAVLVAMSIVKGATLLKLERDG